jgi:hypothetical protein
MDGVIWLVKTIAISCPVCALIALWLLRSDTKGRKIKNLIYGAVLGYINVWAFYLLSIFAITLVWIMISSNPKIDSANMTRTVWLTLSFIWFFSTTFILSHFFWQPHVLKIEKTSLGRSTLFSFALTAASIVICYFIGSIPSG